MLLPLSSDVNIPTSTNTTADQQFFSFEMKAIILYIQATLYLSPVKCLQLHGSPSRRIASATALSVAQTQIREEYQHIPELGLDSSTNGRYEATLKFNKQLIRLAKMGQAEVAESLLFDAFHNVTRGKGGTSAQVMDSNSCCATDAFSSSAIASPALQSEKIMPDVYSFTICIKAWGMARQPGRAQALLQKLEYFSELYSHLEANIVSYHSVVRAWCDVGKVDVAERLLQKMETRDSKVGPDTAIYNCLIYGWTQRSFSKSSHRNSNKNGENTNSSRSRNNAATAAYQVQRILKRMKFLHSNLGMDTQPDVVSYNSVLHALARSGNWRQAESILRQMEQMDGVMPTVVSYASAIDAHAKSRRRGSANHADELLQKLEGLYQEALSRGDDDKAEQLKPNMHVYSTVMNAYAKSYDCKPIAANRVEKLLRTMERLYAEGDIAMKPNLIAYNTAINAFVRCPDIQAPYRAGAIVQRMIAFDVTPDVVTYNSLINVWAKSSDSSAGQRAIEILEEMYKLEESSSGRNLMKANVNTYNSVLNALSRRGLPHEAERILKEMQSRGVRPNTISYNNVITAWAKSADSASGRQAENILDELSLETSNVKPDLVSYCAAMDAWANSNEQGSAEKAERILNRMEQLYVAGKTALKPNNAAYRTVIKAYKNKSKNEGTAVDDRISRLRERMKVTVELESFA